MTEIIDGRKIKEEMLIQIKKEVALLSFRPIFCDVLVGNDPVSLQYVKIKARAAESVGIEFRSAYFPETISTEELVKEIKLLNEIPNMCGIIIQLPLPISLDKKIILDSIKPNLDVDCLGKVASDIFYTEEKSLGFPAALACISLLDSINLDLKDKKIVVLGQGELVGKPVVRLLNLKGITCLAVDSQTKNSKELIKEADIIISGIGQGKYITGDILKNNAVLIDAGTSESNGGIVGDVDLESVKGVAGFISPVPGGVGPVTVAILLNNVLSVAKSFK